MTNSKLNYYLDKAAYYKELADKYPKFSQYYFERYTHFSKLADRAAQNKFDLAK